MDKTNGAKVFVVQEAQLDFSQAEEYGELVFLSHQDLQNIKGSLHNEDVLNRVRGKLIAYEPERDWFVINGSPYVAAAMFLMIGQRLAARQEVTVKVLRWDNRDRVYRPLYLELPK